MSKYVDSEKLIAELTRMQFDLNAVYRHPQSDSIVRAISLEYDDILSLVDSLQQEQPEVDFKIEERKWVHDAVDNIFPEDGDFMSEVDFRKILKDTARHFYELGKNSK